MAVRNFIRAMEEFDHFQDRELNQSETRSTKKYQMSAQWEKNHLYSQHQLC